MDRRYVVILFVVAFSIIGLWAMILEALVYAGFISLRTAFG